MLPSVPLRASRGKREPRNPAYAPTTDDHDTSSHGCLSPRGFPSFPLIPLREYPKQRHAHALLEVGCP